MFNTRPMSTSDRQLNDMLNGHIPRLPTPWRDSDSRRFDERQKLSGSLWVDPGEAALAELILEVDAAVQEKNAGEVASKSTVKPELCPAADPIVIRTPIALKLVPPCPTTKFEAPASASVIKMETGPKTPKRKSSDESEAYEFPSAPSTLTDQLELRVELESIYREYNKTRDYMPLRLRFCAASMALNLEGLWAPGFRPQPKNPPRSAGRPMNMTLHKDRLVIDVHWLWARKYAVAFAKLYGELLDSKKAFDFELAAAYAAEDWTSDYRSQANFHLPPRVQWQLSTTKSETHADYHRQLFSGDRVLKKRVPTLIEPIRRAIATWADCRHQIVGQEQAYAHLWAARKMLGPSATVAHVAELAALMAGCNALDESTVRRKEKSLRSWLEKAT